MGWAKWRNEMAAGCQHLDSFTIGVRMFIPRDWICYWNVYSRLEFVCLFRMFTLWTFENDPERIFWVLSKHKQQQNVISEAVQVANHGAQQAQSILTHCAGLRNRSHPPKKGRISTNWQISDSICKIVRANVVRSSFLFLFQKASLPIYSPAGCFVCGWPHWPVFVATVGCR